MANANVLSVLTFKAVETILGDGGTQSWALDRARAKACRFVVICRNARSPHVEGVEPHGSAFLVGKIKDVVPSTETEGRWLIQLSEYAHCDVPGQWEGRNPVGYWTEADYDQIDFSRLDFQPMPEIEAEYAPPPAQPLTLAQAKAGLSAAFDVAPASIEIIIRA